MKNCFKDWSHSKSDCAPGTCVCTFGLQSCSKFSKTFSNAVSDSFQYIVGSKIFFDLAMSQMFGLILFEMCID